MGWDGMELDGIDTTYTHFLVGEILEILELCGTVLHSTSAADVMMVLLEINESHRS